jgi:hypothetical protein
MVLLALSLAAHLLIERDRGQFGPSRRRRMMANVRAERLLKIPAEPSPELRIPYAAAQTRVVCVAGIRLGSGESARAFKGIICDDISEFESFHPSQPVCLQRVLKRTALEIFEKHRMFLLTLAEYVSNRSACRLSDVSHWPVNRCLILASCVQSSRVHKKFGLLVQHRQCLQSPHTE